MEPITSNPFGVLTFIAAPALLTNSCALLALSTVNRLLRISDRLRTLSAQMEKEQDPETVEIQMRQVTRTQAQAEMVLLALRAIYTALSCFAGASLVSIGGAVFANTKTQLGLKISVIIALVLGICGVIGILLASFKLFQTSQLSLRNIHEDVGLVRKREAQRKRPPITLQQ